MALYYIAPIITLHNNRHNVLVFMHSGVQCFGSGSVKVLVAPITAPKYASFFCPLCKIRLEREIRFKATFVGTRLIVQTNVATHGFAATKRHFEFDSPPGLLWRDMHV